MAIRGEKAEQDRITQNNGKWLYKPAKLKSKKKVLVLNFYFYLSINYIFIIII